MNALRYLKNFKRSAWLIVLAWLFLFVPHVLPASPNLIANSSVETVNPANSSLPQNWSKGGWGTNTRTLSYEATGHSGSRSLKIQIDSYTNGDAKWIFDPVSVNPSTSYTYSDYYQSNIPTELDAQYTDTTGKVSYAYLKAVPASTSWSQVSTTFTTPANISKISIMHIVYSAGWLQTDDFSLTQNDALPPVDNSPAVSMTAPAPSTTLSGFQTLSAEATDDHGVSNVQFKLDGNNLGPAHTSTPYTYSWDTTTIADGSHILTAVATDTVGQSTVSSPVTILISNNPTPAPPSTNLILNSSVETADISGNPASWKASRWGTNTTTLAYQNGGHSGSKSLYINMAARTNGDAKWVFDPVSVNPSTSYAYSDYYQSNIPTELDAQYTDTSGVITYAFLKTVPANASWSKVSVNFITPANVAKISIVHILYGVGWLQTDDFSLTNNPIVTITSPGINSTVSGTIPLIADATYNGGITSVQFQIDGTNFGSPITSSPYQTNWNTIKVPNGSHSITATVTSQDNKTATSEATTVNVSNATTGGNLIPNPSVEIANTSNPTLPQNWSKSGWGTNTTTFSYLNSSGHTGGNSLMVQMSNYTNGSAYWYFTPQSVIPNQQYDFKDFYKSNIAATEVDAVFKLSDGSTKYLYLGTPYASSSDWTKFERQFTAPSNAVSLSVYHSVNGAGWLQTDDFSLTPYQTVGFNRPIVSLTFDDGWASYFNNGLPILNKYGLTATDFIVSGYLGKSGYMTPDQVKQLYGTGHEIGSHTVNHLDLTTLSTTSLNSELQDSQTSLQALINAPVIDFATPFGAYNQTVLNYVGKYYQSFRTVETGYNAKSNFDIYSIKVQNMYVTTTLTQVQTWVQQAQATNTWLVLVYHQVNPALAITADKYNTYPSDLDAQLAYIKSTGVSVETVAQALTEIASQF